MYNLRAQNNTGNRAVDSLQLLLKQAKHDTDRAKIYLELSDVCETKDICIYTEPVIKLVEQYLQTHSINSSIGKCYLKYYATALNNNGYMFFYAKSDYNKSIEFDKKCLKIREILIDKKGIAQSLNSIGLGYRNLGNNKEALSYYYKSLEASRKCGDKMRIADCYGNIYIIYESYGEIDKALKILYKSRGMYEEINDAQGVAYCLSAIARVYLGQGFFSKALEYNIEALKLRELLGDKLKIAAALMNIGVVYEKLGNIDKALEYYENSLQISKEIEDKRGEAMSLNYFGLVFQAQGNLPKALEYFAKSLKLFKEIKYNDGMARGSINIGDIYRRQKNYSKALCYLTKGLDISHDINNVEYIKKASEQLSTIYKQTGNYQKALEYHELYIQMRDSIDSKANQKAIINIELKNQYEQEALKLKQQQTEKEATIKLQNQAQLQRKNYWIFGSLGLLLLLSISGIFIYKNTKQKQKAASQQTIVLEQKLLRSQMNPHFIFNALNSIKNFVLKNESKQAGEHLTDFARLMRLILESSRKDFIVLEDEIHIIESYLKLERLQKNNSFIYTINLSEAIKEEMDSIQIPPLLMQPLIENAIVHGVSHKNGEGLITVNIDMNETNDVVITIEDNGSGINQSRSVVASSNTKKHESYAIQIMNERIEGFKKKYNKNILLRIIDKAELGLAQSGTQVSLTLPVIFG